MIDHAVIIAVGDPRHESQLTYNRIHAMLPALGKPLVARMMDRLYRTGIKRYTVIVGVNEGPVASYLNNHWLPDVNIDLKYNSGQKTLPNIFREIAQETNAPFIVCSYNAFVHGRFPESLIKQHEKSKDALIIGAANSTLSKSQHHYYGVTNGVTIEKIVTHIPRERPSLTLTNFAVCGQRMITYLQQLTPDLIGDMRANFMHIAKKYIEETANPCLAAETAWVLQIENDHDLITLNKHLLEEGQDANILSELPYTVRIIPPVRIDPQVSVGQGATIGPYVYLERGSSVGRHVTIRNAIILQRANVSAEKTVADTIIGTRGPIQ